MKLLLFCVAAGGLGSTPSAPVLEFEDGPSNTITLKKPLNQKEVEVLGCPTSTAGNPMLCAMNEAIFHSTDGAHAKIAVVNSTHHQKLQDNAIAINANDQAITSARGVADQTATDLSDLDTAVVDGYAALNANLTNLLGELQIMKQLQLTELEYLRQNDT